MREVLDIRWHQELEARAAAAVARRLGLVDKKVNVHQPGGTIEIETMEDGTMYMIGSVEFIADLSVAEEFLS